MGSCASAEQFCASAGRGFTALTADGFGRAAVRANPRPVEEHAPSSFDSGGTTRAVEQVVTAAVLQVEPFERFVDVMSVLERYSDLDCFVFLGCARRDVIAARIRALQQLEMQSTAA
jgi:hypothetical protein